MSDPADGSLHLPERPQARDMQAFRAQAMACFDTNQPVAIHAGAVTQLPLAWIQLLIATAREAARRGTTVTITNPTFGFLFAFEALGLQPEANLFTLEFGS